MHGDAVSIPVRVRGRNDRTHWNILQFPNSLKRVPHLSPFNRKLMLIIDVLVRAAPASGEIRALWRYAIRRTLKNFYQLCFGELLLFPHDFSRNHLALNGVRNKNGFALFPTDALP